MGASRGSGRACRARVLTYCVMRVKWAEVSRVRDSTSLASANTRALRMTWRVEGRDGDRGSPTVLSWEAGERVDGGSFEIGPGETAHLVLVDAGTGPCPRPTREEVDNYKGPVLLEFGASW